MKHSFVRPLFLLLAVCLATTVTLAQSEAQRLNVKLAELYQRDDLDAAIPIAEEIVAIERRNNPISTTNLTSALENLAQIKLDRIKRSMSELRSPELTPAKAVIVAKLLRQDAAENDANLREAIGHASTLNASQSVNLRTNLAWLLYNHIPIEPNQSIGFDKDSRDKIEMRQRALYSKRFEEARRLYSEASRIAEDADRGGSMEMASNFNFAEFETAMGNFEAAIPLYAKAVTDAEKLLGKKDPQLLAPYESYLKVLVAAGQQDTAFDVLSRIVTVSGKSTSYPKSLLNLTYRADKAFAPSNSKRIENDSRAIKEQAELAGRGEVARTAAAGGDVVGTTLAVSTHGRDYYATADSKGVRMQRVLVRVEVDEKGRVALAEGLSSDRNLKESAEVAVREWKFRPLSINGKPSKLKGYAEVTILSN